MAKLCTLYSEWNPKVGYTIGILWTGISGSLWHLSKLNAMKFFFRSNSAENRYFWYWNHKRNLVWLKFSGSEPSHFIGILLFSIFILWLPVFDLFQLLLFMLINFSLKNSDRHLIVTNIYDECWNSNENMFDYSMFA